MDCRELVFFRHHALDYHWLLYSHEDRKAESHDFLLDFLAKNQIMARILYVFTFELIAFID